MEVRQQFNEDEFCEAARLWRAGKGLGRDARRDIERKASNAFWTACGIERAGTLGKPAPALRAVKQRDQADTLEGDTSA